MADAGWQWKPEISDQLISYSTFLSVRNANTTRQAGGLRTFSVRKPIGFCLGESSSPDSYRSMEKESADIRSLQAEISPSKRMITSASCTSVFGEHDWSAALPQSHFNDGAEEVYRHRQTVLFWSTKLTCTRWITHTQIPAASRSQQLQ